MDLYFKYPFFVPAPWKSRPNYNLFHILWSMHQYFNFDYHLIILNNSIIWLKKCHINSVYLRFSTADISLTFHQFVAKSTKNECALFVFYCNGHQIYIQSYFLKSQHIIIILTPFPITNIFFAVNSHFQCILNTYNYII